MGATDKRLDSVKFPCSAPSHAMRIHMQTSMMQCPSCGVLPCHSGCVTWSRLWLLLSLFDTVMWHSIAVSSPHAPGPSACTAQCAHWPPPTPRPCCLLLLAHCSQHNFLQLHHKQQSKGGRCPASSGQCKRHCRSQFFLPTTHP
jgi:hypothetical protein